MEEVIPTLMEEGDERIDTLEESSIIAGVQSINGKAGDLDLKTINGQDILTAGNLDLATAEQLATKQDILTAGSNIQIENNIISATDTTYTAGTGLELNGTEFSVDTDTIATKSDLADKQDKLSQAQLTAVNSGIDSAKVTQIATNQGDISTINGKIPNQASTTNQLADKAFVNSSVQTATANYRGSWADWATVPTQASAYPADYAGSTTPTVNDYLVVQDASDYTEETLEGTWRFKYTGSWESEGKNGWIPEYQVNETPMTAAQIAAINSGITDTLVAQISTNAGDIADLQTGKMNANTTFWGQTVQNGAVDGTITLTESGQTATISTTGHNTSVAGIKMGNTSNYVEAGVAGTTIASNNGNVDILAPSGTVDVHGRRITSLAMPSNSTDAASKRYVDNGLATKQDTLTAGAGIDITANVVSATDPAPSGFWTGAGTRISEGTDITIQNALATSPKNINLKGDTAQTTYTGKNLFKYTAITSAVRCSYTDTDGKIVCTATGNSPSLTVSVVQIPAGTYTCSGSLSGVTASPRDGNNASLNVNFSSVPKTITTTAAMAYITFYSSATSGQTFTIDLSDFQVETGSTATSYEPYVGGIPSPNPDYPQDVNVVTGTQTVNVAGKNLFNGQLEMGSLNGNSGNETPSTTNMRNVGFIPVRPNTTYCLNAPNYPSGSNYYWYEYKADQTYNLTTNKGATNGVFTTNEGTYYIRFRFVGNYVDLNAKIMLSEGATAQAFTPFAKPYSVRLGSLELCKIGDYQDYIYTDGTGWWKHKAIDNVHVKNKTSWTINNNCFQTTAFTGKDASGACLCSHFTFNSRQSQITSYLQNGEFGFNTTNTPTFKYTTITTTTAWNQWLTDNDPILYYILETAQDELIVDADLVSDLDALLAAKLATGQNTINNSAVSPNLPAIINVETFENNWNGLSEALLEA